jgi:AraC-like DNA-binding protein
MIGKTRQGLSKRKPIKIVEEYDSGAGKARGILRRTMAEGSIKHFRRDPAPDLAPWIMHYWMIHWDMRGCTPHLAENLPHPNVHLIFEKGKKGVVSGVQTRRFSRVLDDESWVFGVKFRAGGFRPFFGKPISELADKTVPARRVFRKEIKEFETIALSSRPDEEKIAAANKFFLARMPKPDKTIALAGGLVDLILHDIDIKTVDDLVERSGIGKRTLQRIFREYVGASPKSVVCRYRLHEVVEKLNSGQKLDWTQLALHLGYFDQAHLINDFKALVGCTPKQFVKQLAAHNTP